MKTKSLLNKLSKLYPKRIAKENNDFVGLMCGKLPKEVNTILLCLDFDFDVLNYIKSLIDGKVDLVITHHPFLYGSKPKILKENEIKAYLNSEMLKLNIPIYSFHTNFDEGSRGMNDALCEALELKNIKNLTTLNMARGGDLPYPMKYDELVKYVCEKLKVNYALKLNYGSTLIKNVAIIGGGGWFGYQNAKLEKYDCFISGDVPHHGRREIYEEKYNYIDVPHEVERIFMAQMKKVLLSFDENLNVICVNQEVEPEVYIK
jgi:dinuclear metal center YbgI/SA1388 family protein